MNANWDLQAAIESLRGEMHEGFNRVTDKQSDLDSRLTAVETKQKLVGGGLWAMFLAFFGTAVGWFISR